MGTNADLSVAINYNVGDLPVYLTVDDMYRHGYATTAHWHADWEFLAPIMGNLTAFVNGVNYTVPEGAALLVNSGRLHYLTTPARSECRFIDLAVNPDLLTNLPGIPAATVRAKMTAAAPDVVLLLDKTPWQATVLECVHLLGNAYRFGGSDAPTIALETLALCTRILTRLHVDAEQMRPADAGSQLVWQMVDYIQRHYQEPLTATQIAGVVHISRSQCFSLFKAVLHETPSAYLQRVRLAQATTQLTMTRKAVAEIALDCGFGTPSHFIAVFKAARGVTPRHFRTN